MANKLVIVNKGATVGSEAVLDAHTGTDLRGLCYEGGNQFWVTIDPRTVAHYRLDQKVRPSKMRYIGFQFSLPGTVDSIWGIVTDGLSLYINNHRLLTGVHRRQISVRKKKGDPQSGGFIITDGGTDLGNRFRDLEYDGSGFHLINSGGGLFNEYLFRVRMPVYGVSDICETITIDVGPLTYPVGFCMDKQGDSFWMINDAKDIVHYNKDGNVMDGPYTLTNAGTARSMVDLGNGRLAIAMN